jgi:hypothetical protein
MYGGIFRIGTVSTRGAQTRNVSFVETGSTGQADFIVVRYSVTNNGLPVCGFRLCFEKENA